MPSTKLVGDGSCDSFVNPLLRSWECALTPLTPLPPPTRQQTHNQPEPRDGDPRGAARPAGAAHPT